MEDVVDGSRTRLTSGAGGTAAAGTRMTNVLPSPERRDTRYT
ncbi:hypothetical protein J2S57_005894 [Kineosporia succinea]|uniref:Uncharacterized protein n=1 Tax=Kineosporia succinea TaxID=84632 RepID=A0ABT9PDA1_9ACTN|nr:hypothetical protein [Kineosporia succinea]